MGYFRIREIDEVLSTGGLPEDGRHITELKERGFSTIVSLEPLAPFLARQAKEQGIKVVTLAVGWHKPVPMDKIKRFLSLAALAQARKRKIFLHCLHGKDRTMEMTAAYMMAKGSFQRAGELGITAPFPRFFVERTVTRWQAHFEKTLKRAKKYRRPR